MAKTETNSTEETANLVVSGSGTSTKVKRRRWLVPAVAVLILVVAATAAGLLYKKEHPKTTKPEPVNTVQFATPQTYQAVAAKLQSQADQAGSNDKKAAVYDEITLNAQSADQPTATMQAAQRAYNLSPTAARAAIVAGQYELSKDWANAVIWFQKAVDASTPTKPGIDSPYNGYLGDLNEAKSHT